MSATAMVPTAPEGASAPYFVSRLAMTSFRSYDAAAVVSDGRPLVFWGPNGAGKTNILEALSLLAPGRGLRGAKLGDALTVEGGTPGGLRAAGGLGSGDGLFEFAHAVQRLGAHVVEP